MPDRLSWALERAGLKLPIPVFRPPQSAGVSAAEQHAAFGDGSTTAMATSVLAVLAAFYTLFVARAVILPVVIALLLGFLLRGPVRRLKRLGLREPLAAALVVFGGMTAGAISLILLAAPAREWVERGPAAVARVEVRMRQVMAPLVKWEAAATRMTQFGGAGGPATRTPVTVSAAQPGVLRRAFGSVTGALTTSLSVIFLVYFLLASGDLFMRKLQKFLPQSDDPARQPQKVSADVEQAVSTYLRTAVLINIGLGLATWGMLRLLGMPNAGLFGTLAGVLNFVPYLGAILTTGVLAVASLTVFDSGSRAALVPAVYLVLNLIESNGVTPLLMGRQFPLNAVALFTGVMFWGFIWGVPGAILAVPIMVTLKIVSDAVPSMRVMAEFLGD